MLATSTEKKIWEVQAPLFSYIASEVDKSSGPWKCQLTIHLLDLNREGQ